jgi:hypothetical protein
LSLLLGYSGQVAGWGEQKGRFFWNMLKYVSHTTCYCALLNKLRKITRTAKFKILIDMKNENIYKSSKNSK